MSETQETKRGRPQGSVWHRGKRLPGQNDRGSRRTTHYTPLYKKVVTRAKKYYAHDEANEAKIGDRVQIAETRPLSKMKRWRLVSILQRAATE